MATPLTEPGRTATRRDNTLRAFGVRRIHEEGMLAELQRQRRILEEQFPQLRLRDETAAGTPTPAKRVPSRALRLRARGTRDLRQDERGREHDE